MSAARDVSGTELDRSDVPVTLAPMRRRHLKTVLAHEQQVYERPWTMGLFLSELARPETRSYVIARAGALVVGHCGVLYIEDEGHVTTVVVTPSWQQHRIATRMLWYQFAHAIDRGARALTLEVRMANASARRLYTRFGFVPAGVRKGYYAETGENALIMWAHDIASTRMRERLAAIEASLDVPTRLENLTVGDVASHPVGHPAARAESTNDDGDDVEVGG